MKLEKYAQKSELATHSCWIRKEYILVLASAVSRSVAVWFLSLPKLRLLLVCALNIRHFNKQLNLTSDWCLPPLIRASPMAKRTSFSTSSSRTSADLPRRSQRSLKCSNMEALICLWELLLRVQALIHISSSLNFHSFRVKTLSKIGFQWIMGLRPSSRCRRWICSSQTEFNCQIQMQCHSKTECSSLTVYIHQMVCHHPMECLERHLLTHSSRWLPNSIRAFMPSFSSHISQQWIK